MERNAKSKFQYLYLALFPLILLVAVLMGDYRAVVAVAYANCLLASGLLLPPSRRNAGRLLLRMLLDRDKTQPGG